MLAECDRRLQVLWLADNQIRQVQGLATLVALQELNLAANPIATVGNAFAANTSLQQLNLADTHISSFKQVGMTCRKPGGASQGAHLSVSQGCSHLSVLCCASARLLQAPGKIPFSILVLCVQYYPRCYSLKPVQHVGASACKRAAGKTGIVRRGLPAGLAAGGPDVAAGPVLQPP